MALSLTTIANYLFKRANSKSSTNDGRQFFEEPFDGRAPVIPAQLWAQADQIPLTAPTLADQVTAGVVKRYVQLSLTAVPGTTNAFQSDSLRNCIPFNFASDGTYNYALFDSTGASIPFGSGDWLVDPAVGTVTFYGTVPGNMPPKISFFQYVGATGMVSINPTSLTFTQIATPPNTPASGYQTVFIGTDGKAKTIDSTGAIKALGGGGGGAAGKNYLADYYDGSSVTGITSYNQVYTYTFTTSSALVDTLGDAVNFPTGTNQFYTGQSITYSTTGTAIGGLTSGTVYYAIRISTTTFALATTIDNAQAKVKIDLTSIGAGSQSFQSMTYGLSGGAGPAATGLTQTVNTTLPLRAPSNLRLSKDASNRQGMNWAFSLTLDRADVDIGRPMKLAFKFRTSANFTSNPGFNDVFFQLYDLDNNLVVPLDSAYTQPLPVALTTTGMQWGFTPNAGGYNLRLIVDIGNINANAFDLDFSDFEISSAGGSFSSFFATAFASSGVISIGAITTAPTKGTTTFDNVGYARLGDSARLIGQYKQTAAGTAGSGDYLISLPTGLSFDQSKVTFYTSAIGGNTAHFSQIGLGQAQMTVGGSTDAVGFVVPYDATRFRIMAMNALASAGQAAWGSFGSAYFQLSSASVSFSFDFIAPIAGWGASATYSTSEIALKNTPISQVSSVQSGMTGGAWSAMTGNSVTLPPGLWDLAGTMGFDNNGTSPAYSGWANGWFAANGTNSTTLPALLSTIPGITIYGQGQTFYNQQTPSTAVNISPAQPLTIRLTQTATIFLVPNASATTPANARITASIVANKRPDYSGFGVYGQVDIRAATSNTVTATGNFQTLTSNFVSVPVGIWRVKFSTLFGNNGSATGYSDMFYGLYAANGGNTATTPALVTTLTNVVVLSSGYIAKYPANISTNQFAAPDKEIIVRVTTGTATLYSCHQATATSGGNAQATSFITAEKLQ